MDEALTPRESKGFVADEGAMAKAQGDTKRGWGAEVCAGLAWGQCAWASFPDALGFISLARTVVG